MSTNKRLSLVTKFNIMTIALILVTSMSVTSFNAYDNVRDNYKRLLRYGLGIAVALARNCQYAVYTENHQALEQIVRNLGEDSQISYLALLNKGKQSLISRTRESATQIPDLQYVSAIGGEPLHRQFVGEKDGKEYIDILAPVIAPRGDLVEPMGDIDSLKEQEAIGYVQLGLSLEDVKEQVRHFLISITLLTSAIVLIGVGITLVLSRRIASPIKQLALVTSEISKGRIDQTIELESDEEINNLAHSFNIMLHRLREYRGQVERY
jgi:HAMP domain-containing protein